MSAVILPLSAVPNLPPLLLHILLGFMPSMLVQLHIRVSSPLILNHSLSLLALKFDFLVPILPIFHYMSPL